MSAEHMSDAELLGTCKCGGKVFLAHHNTLIHSLPRCDVYEALGSPITPDVAADFLDTLREEP